MNIFRYIRMVLWSFLGIRRRAGADEELSTARPVPLVLIAIALAGGFGALLLWVANYAAGSLG
jgi:hypothetical protein